MMDEVFMRYRTPQDDPTTGIRSVLSDLKSTNRVQQISPLLSVEEAHGGRTRNGPQFPEISAW